MTNRILSIDQFIAEDKKVETELNALVEMAVNESANTEEYRKTYKDILVEHFGGAKVDDLTFEQKRKYVKLIKESGINIKTELNEEFEYSEEAKVNEEAMIFTDAKLTQAAKLTSTIEEEFGETNLDAQAAARFAKKYINGNFFLIHSDENEEDFDKINAYVRSNKVKNVKTEEFDEEDTSAHYNIRVSVMKTKDTNATIVLVADDNTALYLIQGNLNEAAIFEAEIKTEEAFRKYAEDRLKKMHKTNYDDDKAKKTIDGIIGKADGDWGKAVGMLG